MPAFSELGLSQPLLQAVEALGFESPTDIQYKAIPQLLSGETDLIALAQTGTGKTAAFGLPLLEKIEVSSRRTQGLILAPTRELCLQITTELQSYARFLQGLSVVAVYGGASIQGQAKSLKTGAQIIVATPGRMKDMISRGLADISRIEYCVLDEADEMLNMGFYDDLVAILSHSPEDKSTWLFSATMPEAVARISRDFMHHPLEITVGARNKGVAAIRHEYYRVPGRDRYTALRRLVDANPGLFSVIFCRTKRDTQKIAEKLIEDGYIAGALHGDLSQQQRDLVMTSFRKGQLQLLVATDVAARGIDVENISHVIHYQLPDETETYTHRSGRTGRAGKSGVSMVLLTRSEQHKIRALEKITGARFEEKSLPSGMEICEIQLYHLADAIRNTEINPEAEAFLPAIRDVLEGIDRETLIRKMISVEFSRFLERYGKSAGSDPEQTGESQGFQRDGQARYFISLGEKDGLDWMQLKDLIKATTGLGRDDVFRVDTKDTFSFFSTEGQLAPLVLESFSGKRYKGRGIHVELSGDPGGGRSGKRNPKPAHKRKTGKPKAKKAAGKGKKKGRKNRGNKPESRR